MVKCLVLFFLDYSNKCPSRWCSLHRKHCACYGLMTAVWVRITVLVLICICIGIALINPERNPGRMIIMHMGSVGTKYKKSVDPGREI